MANDEKMIVLTVGKRRGTPRPHMRGSGRPGEPTHPKVAATRWTKENNPHKWTMEDATTRGERSPGRPRTALISAAFREGLTHNVLAHGKPTGLTVAEAIGKQQLEAAMNGDGAAVDRILDRTEGPLTLKSDSNQPRHLRISVSFDRKPLKREEREAITV